MFVKCSESRFNSKKTFFDFGSRARETFFGVRTVLKTRWRLQRKLGKISRKLKEVHDFTPVVQIFSQQ